MPAPIHSLLNLYYVQIVLCNQQSPIVRHVRDSGGLQSGMAEQLVVTVSLNRLGCCEANGRNTAAYQTSYLKLRESARLIHFQYHHVSHPSVDVSWILYLFQPAF
jgi:hypothetical protein